uniref:G-protein coupled receptors family 1 profile domain-containing protein n=2 Tax=Wuchereria bancrofti TaxID=6293 RepID=A0AAF5PWU2_WUCBA
MNATVNRTGFENLLNDTNITIALLSNLIHNLHIYGYLIIGPMLVLVNTPVFLLVMLRKALRTPYIVLAVVFLNNGLTGMSATLMGLQRWTISSVQQQLVVHHDCVFDLPIFLLTMLFVDGWSLLMNSVERFCVVAFPLYYYTHNKQIIFALIITQYAITAIAVFFTAVASLIEPKRYISHFCLLQNVYNSHFYVILTLMSSTASLFSIIVMVVVVILLKRKFGPQFLSKHSYNRNLSHFLKNQKRYTHTALISCCFTFFLAVVPSIVQCVYMMNPSTKSQIIVMFCVYLPFMNSFNMVMLFACRQKDLRSVAIHDFKWLFDRRKQHIQPATTGGFLE